MKFKRYKLYHSSYEWQIWQTWQIGVRNNFITLCMSMIFFAMNLLKKTKIGGPDSSGMWRMPYHWTVWRWRWQHHHPSKHRQATCPHSLCHIFRNIAMGAWNQSAAGYVICNTENAPNKHVVLVCSSLIVVERRQWGLSVTSSRFTTCTPLFKVTE
jgi:hypothetical protein